MRLIDLTGQRFCRLVVQCLSARPTGARSWVCRCDCGQEVVVRGDALRRQNTRSCGCLRNELEGPIQPPVSETAEYAVWCAMIQRCENVNNPKYQDYGGRGIRVCRRWRRSFSHFIEDMGFRPDFAYSIDRIDNNKGYYLVNCRWATRSEQQRNKRNTRVPCFP
jgi:hypothetical protein